MKFAHPLFAFAIVVLLAAVVLTPSSRPSRPMGWNFDTGLAPERLRELLCGEVRAAPPAGSWLRVRDLARSRVFDRRGGEVVLGPAGEARPAVAVRRAALEALRGRGYRLVAVLEGGPFAWRGGVRGTDRERRLPLDLRDAFELGRMLAATYGDLVDWWEIENEPDLGFVVDNPETYAAYLKACYLGIQRGRAELRPPHGAEGLSRVLMAPLALPPGPYFEAWARNGGLGYTDGFNYHYYGYAEDFSGVYRQFQSAVAQWSAAGAPTGTASVFSTQFYPSADGWRAQTIATFEFPPGAAGANLQRIRARPVAREEPVLSAQGRWWVTPGVTVEEAASGTWRFTIAERPPGPVLWAPIAELPLPVGWTAPGDAFLSYGYRLAPSGAEATAAPPAPRAEPAPPGFRRALVPTAHLVPAAPAGSPPRPVASALWPSRELPVFLTEYGYGSLSRSARLTAEGRERQRRWFESVGAQIRALGIEGAMAFLLRPYLEVERLEYGLLMNADSGPPPGPGVAEGSALPGARWGAETVSPALADLLRQGRKPLHPRPWTVATPPVQEVVIDFIAGQGLGQAKAYAGYFL
ncbi:MAG: hypothetical protein NTV51_17235, partial [Verrucomicrobia bacterium]|nr:hypothetical protein [Verrucomicrobiota bacterium]